MCAGRRDVLFGAASAFGPRGVDGGAHSFRIAFDALPAEAFALLERELRLVSALPADAGSFIAALGAPPVAVPVFPHGSRVVALGLGPELDTPDRLALDGPDRRGGTFALVIRYASARLSGTELRRNLPWRPGVALMLPAGLGPGRYSAEFRWLAVPAPDATHFTPVPDQVQRGIFVVD
jgi:hypothetical protein